MKRNIPMLQPYTVTYSLASGTATTYTVDADGEEDAKIRADHLFWRAHPELNIFGDNEGLKVVAKPRA